MTSAPMRGRAGLPYSLGAIFRMPLWIALLSGVGLIAALVGDGWLDALSWLALGYPLWLTASLLRRQLRRGQGHGGVSHG